MTSPTRLSRRSHQETLKAYTGTTKLVDHLVAEACAGAWRIVEVVSGSGGPFELVVAWSSGDGAGQEAKMTVARGTRFCVFASSLKVRAGNLSSRENRVSCMVSEGYCVSENHYEVRGEGGSNEAVPIEIPPFARSVRLDTSPASGLVSSTLYVNDGLGTTRAEVVGDEQPAGGLPLAGAGALLVDVPAGTSYRVTFTLSL